MYENADATNYAHICGHKKIHYRLAYLSYLNYCIYCMFMESTAIATGEKARLRDRLYSAAFRSTEAVVDEVLS